MIDNAVESRWDSVYKTNHPAWANAVFSKDQILQMRAVPYGADELFAMCLAVLVLQDHVNTPLWFHRCMDHTEIYLASIPAWCMEHEISPPIVLRETGYLYGFVGKQFGHDAVT